MSRYRYSVKEIETRHNLKLERPNSVFVLVRCRVQGWTLGEELRV